MCCACSIATAQSTSSGNLEPQKGEGELIRRDTLRRDTVWQAAAPRNVATVGDFNLWRLRPKEIEFDSVPAGDTLSVVVTSAGEPFKKVKLYLTDSTVSRSNVPIFKHQSRSEKARNPILTLQSKWSMKRGMAHVEAKSTPPAHPVVRFTVRDLRLKPNGTTKPDTIQQDWVIGKHGEKIMLTELGGVQTDKKGRIFREKKVFKTDTLPSKPIALSPGGVQTLPRGRERVFRYSEFKPGDTLLFSVATVGKKPLKLVALSNDQQTYQREMRETALFTDKVIAGQESYWTLRLEGHWGLQKQQANIAVWRIPPARIKSSVERSDTVIVKEALVEKIILYDTLALLVKDDSLLLTPVLNLSQKNVASMEIAIPKTLPKGLNFMFAAYWIGINRPALTTYQSLEATVPPEWAKPGVPPALCAYALGMPLQLPLVTLSDVVLAFNRGGAYPNDKKGAAPLWGVSLKQNMGIISADKLKKAGIEKEGVYYFHAYFQNNSKVNTYPAQVKVVAFYNKKKD